ncbi:hypothetical protein V491_09197 [Pseudogymnoascus sp. VKM F-3775]|nr:hypothetical protein V491_09197 [Pseudogymnoascus sp. VKM F-3775]
MASNPNPTHTRPSYTPTLEPILEEPPDYSQGFIRSASPSPAPSASESAVTAAPESVPEPTPPSGAAPEIMISELLLPPYDARTGICGPATQIHESLRRLEERIEQLALAIPMMHEKTAMKLSGVERCLVDKMEAQERRMEDAVGEGGAEETEKFFGKNWWIIMALLLMFMYSMKG